MTAVEPPSPARITDWRRRTGPPDNEVGVALAWSGVLGRGPEVSIALTGATVYRTGVRLMLAVRSRADADRQHDLWDAVAGSASDRLLLGVEFADGRVATTAGGWSPEALAPGTPSLMPAGGSGGTGSVDTMYYLHPLPPPGPLAIVCAWPGRGVAETRTEFAGAAEAAAGVLELWPPQDPDDGEPPAPAPPDVPEGGWFARVLG